MAKITKTMRIEEDLSNKLAEIAALEFDGNATAALEAFIQQGIALRSIDADVRWGIYSACNELVLQEMGVERGSKEEYKVINAFTTALWI